MFRFSLIILTFLFDFELYAAKSADFSHDDFIIVVLATERKPFVFYENHLLKGLDVDIIENFAKKFHLSIEYMVENDTVNKMDDLDISTLNP